LRDGGGEQGSLVLSVLKCGYFGRTGVRDLEVVK